MSEPKISCSAGCKRESPLSDAGEPSLPGWEHLEISNRWRCPDCGDELRAASRIVGLSESGFVDALAPDSRGALPKDTSQTITAPTVTPNCG